MGSRSWVSLICVISLSANCSVVCKYRCISCVPLVMSMYPWSNKSLQISLFILVLQFEAILLPLYVKDWTYFVLFIVFDLMIPNCYANLFKTIFCMTRVYNNIVFQNLGASEIKSLIRWSKIRSRNKLLNEYGLNLLSFSL